MTEQTKHCMKAENLKASWRQKGTGERWVTIQTQFLQILFQNSVSGQEQIFGFLSFCTHTDFLL